MKNPISFLGRVITKTEQKSIMGGIGPSSLAGVGSCDNKRCKEACEFDPKDKEGCKKECDEVC
ncbi:hypothetical protein [uncultured Tenacibaculum sp.]|uniref:hypothetical protein n=1 Tax=uncultured Tenacibaculum sp. TaxID=174713 RepID=UPI0026352C29|nr:hypothetical protein [uncultured Tenacibaculum sp.]